MLNFRNTTLSMIGLALLVPVLLLTGIRPGMYPLIPVILWLALLILGSARICMKFYVKAFCKGRTKERVISLTFDDGPDPVVTPEILKILSKHQIRAAFFVIGERAEKHPEILQKIMEEGHVTGLHSYSHAFLFDLYGRKKMERDLVKVAEVAGRIAGKQGDREAGILFRPPYGVTNPTVAKVVKRLGLQVVGWSLRSLDTTIKDPEKVVKRVVRKLHPGAVILLHDTRNDLPDILEKVIKNAQEKGYRFVGLEEMIDY